MLKLTDSQKKLIMAFAGAGMVVASGILAPLVGIEGVLVNSHSFLYLGMVIAWGFLVGKRMINPYVRRQLLLATVLMAFLFVLRIGRYGIFDESDRINDILWYAFYISFTGVPLCAFLAALGVGKRPKEKGVWWGKLLWIPQAILAVSALTTEWHGLFFLIHKAGPETYEHGPLYFVSVAWGGGLSIATFVMILWKCRVSAAKKGWYLPVAAFLFGAGLLALYYIVGGAPTFFGQKIYNVQEAFCLTFILPFEAMIQLGILSGNSRYELFFENGSINAVIRNDRGEEVFVSRHYEPHGDSQDYRVSRQKISGGQVTWYEDLSAIRLLDEQIKTVTEELEGENDLIRQENEIMAERISYETKNRLYDKIAGAVREQAMTIDAILREQEGMRRLGDATGNRDDVNVESKYREGEAEQAGREGLTYAVLLGAYIKRMGNLMLLADENRKISSMELERSIRESMEYFRLTGKTQDFQVKGERMLDARLVILAYELFESVLEMVYDRIYSFAVSLSAEGEFMLKLEADAEDMPVHADWKGRELEELGVSLSVIWVEDYWRVTMKEVPV